MTTRDVGGRSLALGGGVGGIVVVPVITSDVQLGYDHNGTYPNNTQNGTAPDTSANGAAYHDSFFNGDVARGNLTVAIAACQPTTPSSGCPASGWLPASVNTYDVTGNLVKTVDANGNTTTYGYGDNFSSGPANPITFAYRTSMVNAMGQFTSASYDYYTGHLGYSQDLNGITTTNAFNDPMDRVTAVVNAAFSSKQVLTIYTYPSLTQSAVAHDQNSYQDQALVSQQVLDGFGRAITSILVESSSPSQQIATDTTYDALGRVASTDTPWRNNGTTEPALGAYVTTYSYDGTGRPLAAHQPDGSVVTTSYSGNQTTITDEANKAKTITTDGLGRIIQLVEYPGGSQPNITTSYAWSPTGNLTTVTQGTQTRSFSYDTAGRRYQSNQPESGTTNYSYDSVGNLKTVTDARPVTKTYFYDAMNRVVQVSYSDSTATATYTYDNGGAGTNSNNTRGRLLSVSNSNSTTAYTYDVYGNPASSTQTTGGTPYTFYYTFNLSGALLTEQYPDGRVLTTTYDTANRPANLTGALGTVTTNYVTQTQYWPNGIPWFFTRGGNNNVTHANAINSRMQVPESYESIGNANNATSMLFVSCSNWGVNPSNYGTWSICPTAPTGSTPPGVTYNNTSDNGTVQSYQEIWGGTLANLTFNQTFGYDGLNRLTSAADSGGWSRQYNFDQWGNMVPLVGTAPNTFPLATNAPTAFSTTTNRISTPATDASYDPAGNQTSINGNTITFNAENQLSLLTYGVNTVAVKYDGAGRRVQKTVSGTTTSYVYDAFGRLASEYTGGTTWIKDYVRSGRGGLVATENAPGSLVPCTTCYFGFDHLGSFRFAMDQNAAVVARHDYLPFGEEIPVGIAGRTDATFGKTGDATQRFTGQIRDQESGLDYFNARYFTAPFGRFNSVDPGNAGANMTGSQSWNGYAYALGNPLALSDPSGMISSATGCTYQAQYQLQCGGPPSPFWASVLPTMTPNDSSAALTSYLWGVRSSVGWVAGDDPSRILNFYNSENFVQEVEKAVDEIAAVGVSRSCAATLQSEGVDPNVIQSAAASVQVVSGSSPQLANIPYTDFNPTAKPPTYANMAQRTSIGLYVAMASQTASYQMIVVNPAPVSAGPFPIAFSDVAVHELVHITTGWGDDILDLMQKHEGGYVCAP